MHMDVEYARLARDLPLPKGMALPAKKPATAEDVSIFKLFKCIPMLLINNILSTQSVAEEAIGGSGSGGGVGGGLLGAGEEEDDDEGGLC